MYKHILIPADGSELSTLAVEQGLALAKALDASVLFLSVYSATAGYDLVPEVSLATSTDYHRHAEARAGRILASAEQRAKVAGVSYQTVSVESDHPYKVIIDVAREHRCDLIAMSSHGRRGIGALVLGSETTKVLTHSKTPVLVFRN